MAYLAADVGGTFVDIVLFDSDTNRINTWKVSSTGTEADGILNGIKQTLSRSGAGLDSIERFVHGFTIGTNAWLTRRGARTALIVTRGFKDILQIGTQRRPHLYSLVEPPRVPLVADQHVFEVGGRIDSSGSVVEELDPEDLARLCRTVAETQPEVIAVSLIFSHLNMVHEEAVAHALRKALPDVQIYLSSVINPQIEEFPRTNTTVAAAYVGPITTKYVTTLEDALKGIGLKAPLALMRSDGGIATPASARRNPASMLLSGPAGGVVAAEQLARAVGIPDLVTFDMGGTSADFSLIKEYRAQGATDRLVNGEVLRLPMMDIETISAGGGSIAAVDHAGALLVGPASAGSIPGPACYDRGGTEPTLTDALLVLGMIDPDNFAGGSLRLDVSLAHEAIRSRVATPLNLSVEDAALGMIEVSCAHMQEAIRGLTVQRGFDLRSFSLLAFGGGGAIFGSLMSADLSVKSVVIPPTPGVFAALGLLMSDIKHTSQTSFSTPLETLSIKAVIAAFTKMREELDAFLADDGIAAADRTFELAFDMRYLGQFHNITVPCGQAVLNGEFDAALLADAFHAQHKQSYGHADAGDPVEVTALRMVGVGKVRKAIFPKLDEATAAPGPKSRRMVKFERGQPPQECAIYDRAAVGPGGRIHGPAIIEQSDTTIILTPRQQASSDAYGVLHISQEGE